MRAFPIVRLCGGLFVLGFAIRSIQYPLVFTPVGIQLPYAGDAYYHLRRIWFSVARFPETLPFDRYVSHPTGSQIVWPSTFDWTIAAAIRPFVDSTDQAAVEAMAVWAPVLLGAITTALAGWLAARLHGRGAGWCAGILYAVLPMSFSTSRLGMIDHHVAVAMLGTVMLGLACESIGREERDASETARGETDGRTWTRRAGSPRDILLGLAIGVMISTWPGALLHVLVLQIAFALDWLLSDDVATARRRAASFATTQLVASLCLAPLSLGATWREYGAWSPLVLSNLQPVYFASAAVTMGLVQFLHERSSWGASLGRRTVSALAFVVAGSLAAVLVIPTLREAVLFAGSWFTGRVELLGQINELRPIFMRRGVFDAGFAIVHFGPAFLILPLLWAHAARGAWRARSRRHGLFVFWVGAFGVLTLEQWRFGNTLAVAFAILVGAVLAEWLATIGPRLASRRLQPIAESIAVLALVVWTVGAFRIYYEPILKSDLNAIASEHRRSLGPLRARIKIYDDAGRWLAQNSPPTGGYLDPSVVPEYGVLAGWAQGHILRYRSERPMVQDNFGSYAGRESFELGQAYYASNDEQNAIEILERLGVRYVLGGEVGGGSPKGLGPDSIALRLAIRFGSTSRLPDGRSIQGLGRHRLIFHTHSAPPGEKRPLRPARPYTSLGVWEIVEGARIEGRADPGSTIDLWLGMETTREATDTYHLRSIADAEGSYRFVVPYPTDVSFSPAIRVARAYQISGPRGRGQLFVRESDVRSGGVIRGPDL